MVDWRALPVPGLLWLNTGVLVLSSVAMQWAQVAARRDEMDGVMVGLCAGAFSPLHSWLGRSWRGDS